MKPDSIFLTLSLGSFSASFSSLALASTMVQIGGKAALNSAGMTSKMAPLYPSDGPKMAALWPGRPENLN